MLEKDAAPTSARGDSGAAHSAHFGTPHSAHWGAFRATLVDGEVKVAPHPERTRQSLEAHDSPAPNFETFWAFGEVVRLYNARGACLAAASLSQDVAPGVIHLPTGAWYDPDPAARERPDCVHGNPNVLTRDIGTSRLAQGCTGQITTVECLRFDGPLPPIRAFDPPV